jgi:hypothetical protein
VIAVSLACVWDVRHPATIYRISSLHVDYMPSSSGSAGALGIRQIFPHPGAARPHHFKNESSLICAATTATARSPLELRE